MYPPALRKCPSGMFPLALCVHHSLIWRERCSPRPSLAGLRFMAGKSTQIGMSLSRNSPECTGWQLWSCSLPSALPLMLPISHAGRDCWKPTCLGFKVLSSLGFIMGGKGATQKIFTGLGSSFHFFFLSY